MLHQFPCAFVVYQGVINQVWIVQNPLFYIVFFFPFVRGPQNDGGMGCQGTMEVGQGEGRKPLLGHFRTFHGSCDICKYDGAFRSWMPVEPGRRVGFKRGGSRSGPLGPSFLEGPAIEKIQSRSKISIPARKFQSRSKFSISIEKFNPRVSIYGALVVYRERLDRKFQSKIDRSKFSIPKATIKFFQSPGPLGFSYFPIFPGFFSDLSGDFPDWFFSSFFFSAY